MSYFTNSNETLFVCDPAYNMDMLARRFRNRGHVCTSLKKLEYRLYELDRLYNHKYKRIIFLAELGWRSLIPIDCGYGGYLLLQEILINDFIPYDCDIAICSATYSNGYKIPNSPYRYLTENLPIRSLYTNYKLFDKHFLMRLQYRRYSDLRRGF